MQYFIKNDTELIYSSFKKGNNTVTTKIQNKSNNDKKRRQRVFCFGTKETQKKNMYT